MLRRLGVYDLMARPSDTAKIHPSWLNLQNDIRLPPWLLELDDLASCEAEAQMKNGSGSIIVGWLCPEAALPVPPSLMWSSPHVFNHRNHGVRMKCQALHFAVFSTQSSWLKRRTYHCPSSPTHTETLDISGRHKSTRRLLSHRAVKPAWGRRGA